MDFLFLEASGKMKSKIKFGLLVLYAVLVLSASVQAVIYPLLDPETQVNSGWAFVARSDLIEGGQVAYPYVYGVTGDAVTIQLDKLFNRPFSLDGFNYPIIIEFWKLSANATSKIIIRDEYIENGTGREWTDYHMHLMVDALDPQAGFDPNFIPDGDKLENVSYALNYGYNDLPIELNFKDANDSGVPSTPPAEPGENTFWLGNYGGQIVIVTDPKMQVGEHFGLKEIPTAIPEPATLVLLGTAGIWIFTRKKRSARPVFRRP
jgi:hypothetical protein